jgi:hypothetical protein
MGSGKSARISWIAKLNKPWLHFIVLGAVLFQVQSLLFPAPKAVIGPLSEARISALQAQWLASTARQPTPEQTARFIALELDRDMLFKRALELDFHLYDGITVQRLIRNMKFLQLALDKSDAALFDQALEIRLHLDDEVVKRRLIQLMEKQLLAENPTPKPSEEEVSAAFENRKEELRRPSLYSIEHVFFPRERESEVLATIATITEQKLDVLSARQLGSPFLQGHQFVRQTSDQLARNFGKGFVLSLEQALNKQLTQSKALPQNKTQQWLGPIRSAYGLHYVWIAEFEPGRDAQLREVERQLRHDLEYEDRKQALQCAIRALRKDYDIRVKNRNGFYEKSEERCQ